MLCSIVDCAVKCGCEVCAVLVVWCNVVKGVYMVCTPCCVAMHHETCIVVMCIVVCMEENSRECALCYVVIHRAACHKGLDGIVRSVECMV